MNQNDISPDFLYRGAYRGINVPGASVLGVISLY